MIDKPQYIIVAGINGAGKSTLYDTFPILFDKTKRINATYGTQSADWWSARQIHHIRPRIYGGTDDFNNLLPVPNANHYLITSWFRNY